jgi:hypothetical protein
LVALANWITERGNLQRQPSMPSRNVKSARRGPGPPPAGTFVCFDRCRSRIESAAKPVAVSRPLSKTRESTKHANRLLHDPDDWLTELPDS